MLASDSRVERSASVSSIRRMNVPSLPCASNQLNNAVRALPTWSCPVGLGANLTRMKSASNKQRHGVRRDCLAPADGVDPFVGLPLHTDTLHRQRHSRGETGADALFVRCDLRPLENDDHVEIDDLVAGLTYESGGAPQ